MTQYLLQPMFLVPLLFTMIASTIHTADAGGIDLMVDEMSEINYTNQSLESVMEFFVSIKYVFPGDIYDCVSVSGDKSYFHDKVVNDFSDSDLPLVMANNHNVFKCVATFIVVKNVENLLKIIKTQPFWSHYRYYILIYEIPLTEFEDFFQNKVSIFRDAELAICIFNNFDKCLIYGPPDQQLTVTDTLSFDAWNLTDVAPQRPIRFTMGNCDMHSVIRGDVYDFSMFEGIDWTLFKQVINKMNYTIQFVNTTEWEYLGEFNGTWQNGGILGSLVEDLVDVGFCGIWIDERKMSPGIQMSVPINQVCVMYIVPRPLVARISTNAFSTETNIMNHIILVSLATLITGFARLRNEKSVYSSWVYSVLVMMGAFVQGNYPASTAELGSARSLICLCALLSVIMATVFSGRLVSNFTSPIYNLKPTSLEELVKFGYSGPYMGGRSFPWSGAFNLEDPLSQEWIKRAVPFDDINKLLNYLRTEENQAVLGFMYDKTMFIPSVQEFIPDKVFDQYEIMSSCVSEVYEGFAFQEGSPFIDQFNKYLTYFKQHGLIKKIHRDYLQQRGAKQPALKQLTVLTASSHELKPLAFRHIKRNLFVHLFVLMAATVIFVLEIVYNRYSVA